MSTAATTTAVYYLEHCPFSDKDQVKSLGAKWDASARKWFVPSNLFSKIEQFSTWRPNNKVFLNCTFDEKDNVKKAGAKWDAQVKRWFITCGSGVSPPAKFSKWLKVSADSATSTSGSLPAMGQKKQQQQQQQQQGNNQEAMPKMLLSCALMKT
jgi:hypothetical protein